LNPIEFTRRSAWCVVTQNSNLLYRRIPFCVPAFSHSMNALAYTLGRNADFLEAARQDPSSFVRNSPNSRRFLALNPARPNYEID